MNADLRAPVHLLKGGDEILLGEAVTDLVRQLVGDGDRSLMVEELTLVVDAINAGDADGAYAASLAHVRSAADIALDHLLEQKEQSATA